MKSIIMTGGYIAKPDSLYWCSEKHYQAIQDQKNKRYWNIVIQDMQKLVEKSQIK